MDKSVELTRTIADYKMYQEMAKASLVVSPYHAFKKDLEDIIAMCDSNILKLNKELHEILRNK